MLVGEVCKAPEVRFSPAGIPIARFTLEHRSIQPEAGLDREAYCKVIVVAAGETLKKQVKSLVLEQLIRVSGFVARADNRQGDSMLVLHAQQIELLAKPEKS